MVLSQAEFAKSAVDFLHRTGRTGRAGQYGIVTSLYSESSRDLVAAVRQAEDLGRPVVLLHTLLQDNLLIGMAMHAVLVNNNPETFVCL